MTSGRQASPQQEFQEKVMEAQAICLEAARKSMEAADELRRLNEWAVAFGFTPLPPQTAVILPFRPRQLAEAAS